MARTRGFSYDSRMLADKVGTLSVGRGQERVVNHARAVLWSWIGWSCLWLAACGVVAAPTPPSAVRVHPLFDPQALVEGKPPRGGTSTKLEIRDYGPEGAAKTRTIRVRFNRSVVDMTRLLGQRGDSQLRVRASSGSHADPGGSTEVLGRSVWAQPDVLEFYPRRELAEATSFEVELVPGSELAGVSAVRWRFETARPRIRVLAPDEPLLPDEPLFIEADPGLGPESLAEHLAVRLAAGPGPGPEPRTVALTVTAVPPASLPPLWSEALAAESIAGARVWALRAEERWPAGSKAELRVDARLRGAAGPLGVLPPLAMPFSVYDGLRIERFECAGEYLDWCEDASIVLRSTTSLPYDASDSISVTPRPEGAWVGIEELEPAGGSLITVRGDFDPGRRYVVSLPASLQDEHGQRLGRRWTRRIRPRVVDHGDDEQVQGSRLSLTEVRGTFRTAEQARVGVWSVAVPEVRVRALRLGDADRARWLGASRLAAMPWPAGSTQVVLMRPGTHDAPWSLDLARFAGLGDAVLIEVQDLRDGEDAADPVRGLYQISDIGALVSMGPARGVLHATRGTRAEPWPELGVHLRVEDERQPMGRTDRTGAIRLPGAEHHPDSAVVVLEDPQGEDRLFVPLRALGARRRFRPSRNIGWDDPAPRPKALRRGEQAVVELQLGRGVYLPGDTVHLAGWGAVSTPYGTLATRRAPDGAPVVLELQREAGTHRGEGSGTEVVATRRVRLDQHGRFSASIPLPPRARLGSYSVRARLLRGEARAPFVLADARVPTFEVLVSPGPDPVRGDPIRLQVRTQALGGDPIPVERLDWTLRCSSREFVSPRHGRRWSFSADSWPSDSEDPFLRWGEVAPATGGSQAIELALSTSELGVGVPFGCHVSVAALNAALQQQGADTSVFVHPADVYLGVKPPLEPTAGQASEVEVIAVDVHGREVAASAVSVVVETDPDLVWDPRRVVTPSRDEVARCPLSVAADAVARCPVPELEPGPHRVRAWATVGGVQVRADARFEVGKAVPSAPVLRRSPSTEPQAPADRARPSPRRAAGTRPRSFALRVPSHPLPAATAFAVTVEAPPPASRGVLSIVQTGLREVRPFELRDGVATVLVTPRPGQGPVLELVASYMLPGEGARLPRVVTRREEVRVQEVRELDVVVSAPATASPRQRVPITIDVRDRRGRPVDARVAVWAVDDGIHALRAPRQPSLSHVFNPARPWLHQSTRSQDALLHPFVPRAYHRRARIPQVRRAKAQVRGALAVDMTVRSHFESVPLFEGNVGTGPDGRVVLTLPLADDLTRFRISAVASAEVPASVGKASGPARFGRGHADVAVSAPLQVRAVLPRVLRPGDRAEVGARVVTPPGQAGSLVVEADTMGTSGALRWTGPTRVRRRVTGARPTTVRFGVRAVVAGPARVQLRARFEPDDAVPLRAGVERELSVEVERTQVERVAVYGRIDDEGPVAIPVRVPDAVRPEVGGLALSLRNGPMATLEEAADYLQEYPYGCLEQTSSRLLPLVALRGLQDRLSASETRRRHELWTAGLDHLLTMQRSDGSFVYWPSSDRSNGYAGAYATWVLQQAAEAGHAVPQSNLNRALGALERALDVEAPASEGRRGRWRVERALTVQVLADAGRGSTPPVQAALDDLFVHRDTLPGFGRAMLLMALHRADPLDARVAVVRRQLSSDIHEQPAAAYVDQVPAESDFSEYFDSAARTHALVLMAWLQIDPQDPLVDKLAFGLEALRTAGRWRNTQENAYALLALSAHARSRPRTSSGRDVEVWVGNLQAGLLEAPRAATGQGEGQGEGQRRAQVQVSMAELLSSLRGTRGTRATRVTLDPGGPGRSHYRLSMEWAALADAPARDQQGLVLERSVVGVDGDEPLQAGRRYRLRVTLETAEPQRYLAVELPLPAGLEAIDTRLGAGADARAGVWIPRGSWVSHEELHRDRVLLFADELPPGRSVHTIPVIASTPGDFVLPAAQVEAMYTPEIRARTETARIRVER